MRETKHRVYSPNNQEKLKEAMEEVYKQKEECIDIIPFPTSDFFVVLYKEKDKSFPTEEDSIHYSTPSNEISGTGNSKSIIDYIKEYKLFVIIIVLAALYYFFVL